MKTQIMLKVHFKWLFLFLKKKIESELKLLLIYTHFWNFPENALKGHEAPKTFSSKLFRKCQTVLSDNKLVNCNDGGDYTRV